jgi:hypothetical protein
VPEHVIGETLAGLDVGAPEAAPTVRSDGRSHHIKLGQHSVNVNNVTDKLIVDMSDITQAAPNFIQMYANIMIKASIIDFDNSIAMRSYLCRSAAGGGTAVPVPIHGRVLPYHLGRIAPHHRQTLVVEELPGRSTGLLEKSAIERLFNAGVPNKSAVTSALQPTLRVGNAALLRGIYGAIAQNWDVYDNSLIYAKLIYFAAVLDCYQYINVVPAVLPFPSGDDPIWIDRNADKPEINLLLNSVDMRRIILVQDVDFHMVDLQMVYWLAKSGVRIDGPDDADAHVMENSYVHWPAVPITILGHGPAPGPPAPAIKIGSAVLSFALNLATRRNEWADVNRALYIALDLIGVRYNEFQARFYPIRTNLSYQNLRLYKPADYNFMFWLLNIYPKTTEEEQREFRTWLSSSPAIRTQLCTLYTVVLASASTTALYDLNLTSEILTQWGMGLPTSQLAMKVFNSPFNTPPNAGTGREVVMLHTPKKAFPVLLGCNVLSHLYPEQTWTGKYGQHPNANGSLAPYPLFCPPQLFPILCGDNWYRIRLVEWGISGPMPSANFQSEVDLIGEPNMQGWYSNLGTEEFNRRANGDSPIKLVVYSNQALKIILQLLDHVDAPLISHSQHSWIMASHISWIQPVPIPGAQVVWNIALRIIEPCTLMTYSYVTNQVLSPCYLQPHLGKGELNTLLYLRGQPLQTVGIEHPALFERTATADWWDCFTYLK